MIKEELFLGIEKVLDKWDPIGVLQDVESINYEIGVIGEYTKYIQPLIDAYKSDLPIYDFLIKLQGELSDSPNKEMKEETKLVAQQIIQILDKYPLTDLQ